jgi:hypothetical protein
MMSWFRIQNIAGFRWRNDSGVHFNPVAARGRMALSIWTFRVRAATRRND